MYFFYRDLNRVASLTYKQGLDAFLLVSNFSKLSRGILRATFCGILYEKAPAENILLQ